MSQLPFAKYDAEFRKDHPETIGETDQALDLSNYCEWLEKRVADLNRLTSSFKPETEFLTDAELDVIYPESHNLGTYHQEIHSTRLRKVIVAALGKSPQSTHDTVEVPREAVRFALANLLPSGSLEAATMCSALQNSISTSANHDHKDTP